MGKTEKVKKTKYEFKCNEKVALDTINQFLKANDYKELTNSNGETYYKFTDGIVVGFLEYNIQSNLVTLYAYIRSEKKPMPLDDSFVGIIPKSHYKGIIDPLLKALSNSNSENTSQEQPQKTNDSKDDINTTKNNDTYNQFDQKNKNSKGKFAIIAFIVSLIGLFLSFFGLTYGVIIIILECYFAIQGLKSDKKVLSIAAIVLISVSILINLFWLILSLAYNYI